MSLKTYDAKDIEVLTGLDPVRKRPGMYTDTTRPNHLAQEVIDNSVDEALAGHAKQIEVILHVDGSLSVIDDGRGMPVDDHPEQKKPGVEVILSTLHAGGKFSNNSYQFSKISVLDLFAGTGNISFEFASRGCKNITCIDINKSIINSLKKSK